MKKLAILSLLFFAFAFAFAQEVKGDLKIPEIQISLDQEGSVKLVLQPNSKTFELQLLAKGKAERSIFANFASDESEYPFIFCLVDYSKKRTTLLKYVVVCLETDPPQWKLKPILSWENFGEGDEILDVSVKIEPLRASLLMLVIRELRMAIKAAEQSPEATSFEQILGQKIDPWVKTASVALLTAPINSFYSRPTEKKEKKETPEAMAKRLEAQQKKIDLRLEKDAKAIEKSMAEIEKMKNSISAKIAESTAIKNIHIEALTAVESGNWEAFKTENPDKVALLSKGSIKDMDSIAEKMAKAQKPEEPMDSSEK